MYYVPEGTTRCGYYECEACGEKFLSLQTTEYMTCPYCEAEIDPEIGPDETRESAGETAKLLRVLTEGEEVEKMDALLSLAITGGNYEWI